ncbi:MAG: hypothetical protein EXR64_04340 [Dehalococcoidia bacterium]|nr:hypothetical protein [Dehalococcoidia bacterium]
MVADAAAPVYRVRVAEMPDAERPRERLERLGPAALRTEDLIAILLRTGTAREDVLGVAARLLHERSGLRGLAATDLATLGGAHGIGPAKATTIAAAFELGRRVALEDGASRPTVTGPADIARLFHAEMELLQQVELRVIVLDTRHHVLAAPVLYRGTVSAAGGRVAELFREAVRLNAAKVASRTTTRAAIRRRARRTSGSRARRSRPARSSTCRCWTTWCSDTAATAGSPCASGARASSSARRSSCLHGRPTPCPLPAREGVR